MFNFSKKRIFALLIIIGLCSFSPEISAANKPWPQDQFVFYIELVFTENFLMGLKTKDYDAIRLVQSVINNPDLRDDERVAVELGKILKRVELLRKLDKIYFVKESIKDEHIIKDLERWLDNQPLLDDPDEIEKAESMFFRFELIKKLENGLSDIEDDSTKELINNWLENSSMLDEEEVLEKVYYIFCRIKLTKKLKPIFESEEELIQDDETKELIKKWLENPVLLQEEETCEEAEKVIRRIKLFELLKLSMNRVRCPEDKKLVESWLENQLLLDDEDVQEKAFHILECASQWPIIQKIKNYRRAKLGSIAGFTTYRKISFLKAMSSCKARGWFQRFLDYSATGAYLGGNLYEVYLRACRNLNPKQQELSLYKKLFGDPDDPESGSIMLGPGLVVGPLFPHLKDIVLTEKDGVPGIKPEFQAKISSWQSKCKYILKDDISDKISSRNAYYNEDDNLYTSLLAEDLEEVEKSKTIQKLVRDKAALEDKKFSSKKIVEINKKILEEIKNLKLNDSEKIMKNKKERRKKVQEFTKRDINENGFRGSELEFFDTFDSYLDMILESKVNKLLKTVNIPKPLRYIFWKNGAVGFVRENFIFKFLPTFGYWYLFEKKSDHDEFKDHIFFKEVSKSIGWAFEQEILSRILRRLNGDKDHDGMGRLDRAKEKTLGLVGPNLAKFILRHSLPFGVVEIANKIMKDDLLSIRDIHPTFPWRPRKETFDPLSDEVKEEFNKKYRKKVNSWFAKETVGFAGKNVLAYFLVKALKKVRPVVVNNVTKKTGKFMDFLVRRNWIKRDSRATVGMLGKSLFTKLSPFVAILLLQKKSRMTDYDVNDAWREFMKEKDEMVFVDHLLASAIAEKVSEMFAEWLIDEKLKGTEFRGEVYFA